MRREFNHYGHDRCYMLDNQMKGRIDSWAIRFGYSIYKNKMYAILPVVTKVENFGFDGSGVHNVAGETKFINHISNNKRKVHFENVKVDERIRKEYVKKFNPNLITRIKRAIKALFND